MVTLTPEECGYIAACSLYYRKSVRGDESEELQPIAENIMILEQSGIGQGLLTKLRCLLVEDDLECGYHG